VDCEGACQDAGCRESPHRAWVADQVQELAPGPGGAASISQQGAGAAWASGADSHHRRDASWRRVKEHGGQVFALLADGGLWSVDACGTQPVAQQVAQQVLDFMPHQGWLYTLEQGGRLRRAALGGADPAALLREEVAAFAVNDEALWTLDAQGTLWRHQHDGTQADLEAQEVRQIQASGDALYTLSLRSCLWQTQAGQRIPLDAHRQAFALSGTDLYVMHDSGHLWRLYHSAPCPASGCQETLGAEALSACLEAALPSSR
jgi:hypothetical protein